MNYQHLLGKPFVHGQEDCFSIVRDFFAGLGINIRNYARADGWWDAGLNLYMENFRAEGFESVDVSPHQAKFGDVFLLSIKSVHANHAGILVEPNLILHHYLGRLSEVVPLSTMWRNPSAIVRHPDVAFEEPKGKIDLMNHILPHKRALYAAARSPTS